MAVLRLQTPVTLELVVMAQNFSHTGALEKEVVWGSCHSPVSSGMMESTVILPAGVSVTHTGTQG